MKVLNLQCAQQHVFEGWFGSEEEFQSQLARGLLSCPVCADQAVHKLPSAPRLNLRAHEAPPSDKRTPHEKTPAAPRPAAAAATPEQQAAWLQLARELVRRTEDVGRDFAEEARRIHQGEAPERGIRGQASAEETLALLEEGIPVLPLPLPELAKETLQ